MPVLYPGQTPRLVAGPPPFHQDMCTAQDFAKQMLNAGLLEMLSPTPVSPS